MKKIVYFDIDGTLLDVTRNFNVSAKTQQSLRQLRADGNLTIITPGVLWPVYPRKFWI
jgi:hydroxymethylpyrimidine pyrophosphatase-like HAD family hydrolase